MTGPDSWPTHLDLVFRLRRCRHADEERGILRDA
jgi:hypothetical protein